MPQEVERPYISAKVKKSEKAKETRVVEKPKAYKIYQRGARKLFEVDRQVFTPLYVEESLPSSSGHRKMFSPQNVQGALPCSSTQQVQQVQQLHKGKEKVMEESLDDEEEMDFDLMEDDEPKQPHIHQGIEIVDLEAQDEATNENITIRKKDA